MKELYDLIPVEAQIPLKLRLLFEKYGYREYKMSKFESYDSYRDNANFLKDNSIITFTDAKGKLLALKPDITMSIVNNLRKGIDIEKYYYIENVFRRNTRTGEYREIKQIGIEYIGESNSYSETETVWLALQSLKAVSTRYVLNLSHMGFVSALFDESGIDEAVSGKLFAAMGQKNKHEISRICTKKGIDKEHSQKLQKLCNLPSDFNKALGVLDEMADNDAMNDAVSELRQLFNTFNTMDMAGRLKLDFSVTSDMDYYNGLLMQGYVAEIPKAILSGGRYDNLMKKCGRDEVAIGFALYLEGIERAMGRHRKYRSDVAVVYGDNSPDKILKVVNDFTAQGKTVITVREAKEDLDVREIYKIGERTIQND